MTLNVPERVRNTSAFPEVVDVAGGARIDSTVTVDTCYLGYSRKGRAVDTTENSTVTALLDVGLDLDTLEPMQLILYRTSDGVVLAERRALGVSSRGRRSSGTRRRRARLAVVTRVTANAALS